MMEKIDENLLKVFVLSNDYIYVSCVVFLNSYEKSFTEENIKKVVGKENIIKYFPFLNAYAIKIKKSDLEKLSNFTFVEYVSSVQKASIMLNNSRKYLKIDKIHKKGITGKGVGVAIIDTGCYPHIDFMLGKKRITTFCDLINSKSEFYDDNGHGTFVSGVLAGNGYVKNGKYKGVAPGCDLVIIKALDKNGETNALTILNAMQYVLDNSKKLNIKVVCMSFGSIPLTKNDPLIEGAKVLWENGICVVCAGGNDGPNEKTIKSPGACPNVITVGSADKIFDMVDIKVAPFSSRGPVGHFIKPDIIAPGVDIISTSNDKSIYTTMSGTSVATPFVAGLCALILEVNPNFSPNLVKTILMNNARRVSEDENATGSGFVDFLNIFE